MGKTLIKGCLVGGVILFVWMMISWMVLPWHCSTLGKLTNESAVSEIIASNAPHDGVYVLPNFCHESDRQNNNQVTQQGPIVLLAVQHKGFDVKSPSPYILSLIIQLIGAFFVTYMLLQTKELSYWHKVWFVTVFGIAAGVLAAFPNWVWWGFSFGFAAVEFFDFVIGWFLVGLALAAFKK